MIILLVVKRLSSLFGGGKKAFEVYTVGDRSIMGLNDIFEYSSTVLDGTVIIHTMY